MISRRQFLKTTAGAAGALAASGILLTPRGAQAYSVSMPLQKFIQPMPLFGPDIPLATPAGTPYNGVDYYQLTAGAFRQQLHPHLSAVGGGQRLFGYADHKGNFKHLGGAIVANYGRPVRFSFNSALPPNQIVPFDVTLPSPGNGGKRQDRAAVHLHGGLVPWPSDGGPFHWQCPDPTVVGSSVIPWLWDGTKNVWDYFYPNLQSARLMWYHDHAVGITRTNAYSGLATGYIIGDANDNIEHTGVLNTVNNIPFLGQPIVFQDKVFWDDLLDPGYANFVPGVQRGDLWYPYLYEPAIWPIAKGGTPPTPSAVPEFFGDTMLANGVVYPFHAVNPGMYRFRLLNACNARFLDLSFVYEDPAIPGEPLFIKNKQVAPAAVDVWQIGTEGGFLPVPVQLVANGIPLQPFILGPAERADIIVRFNAAAANSKIILYNVAGSPFPGGAPIFDWFVGSKSTPVPTMPGFGPNTRTVMQFVVGNGAGPVMTLPVTINVSSLPTVPDPVNGGLMVDTAALPTKWPGFLYDPMPVQLTLNEVVEPATFTGLNTGRLLTLIGNRAFPTGVPFGAGGTYYFEAPTESVRYNTIRIWYVFNLTADAHPMHFHLFNVQVLGRRKIARGNLSFAGAAVPPLPNEMGFKETVVMYPGQCTIVAAVVEDPLPAPTYPRDAVGRPQVPVNPSAGAPADSTVPFSPRLQGFGIFADEYVWHCHILEHEEHDMMRPLTAT